MKVLIVNDDGIYAKGLKVLKEVFSKECTVYTVAPLNQQSATSHNITIFDPIRTYKIDKYTYAVDGTPVDCVRLALEVFYKKDKPDIVISGINPGINAGNNILYSGTVAAALEGCVFGLPAIAVSIDGFEKLHYKNAAEFAFKTAKKVLQKKLNGFALNINIPNILPQKIKGVKTTVQGNGMFQQVYHQRLDPRKNRYFWPDGKMTQKDTNENSDYYAVKKGYISVTPLKYNFTDTTAIPQVKNLVKNIS